MRPRVRSRVMKLPESAPADKQTEPNRIEEADP